MTKCKDLNERFNALPNEAKVVVEPYVIVSKKGDVTYIGTKEQKASKRGYVAEIEKFTNDSGKTTYDVSFFNDKTVKKLDSHKEALVYISANGKKHESMDEGKASDISIEDAEFNQLFAEEAEKTKKELDKIKYSHGDIGSLIAHLQIILGSIAEHDAKKAIDASNRLVKKVKSLQLKK